MSKLRNGKTEMEKFAQWIGRKCKNHNPLSELVKTERVIGVSSIEVGVAGIDKQIVLYRSGTRAFAIHIEEIDVERFEASPRDAVRG